MSAHDAADGIAENATVVPLENESAVIPDLGLSSIDEQAAVRVEDSDATHREAGVIENGRLVNSLEVAEEESNSYAYADSSERTDTCQVYGVEAGEMNTGNGEVILHDHAGKHDVVTIPSSIAQVDDHVVQENTGVVANIDGPMQDYPNDENIYEDASKEEMFVDAPDHMTVVDGRNLSVGEFNATIEATQEDLEKEIDVREMGGVDQINCLMDNLANLHAQLEKAISDKELVSCECKKYKEEREMFARKMGNLHQQLQVLTNQRSLLAESNDGLVDHTEKEGNEDKTLILDKPLHALVDDCSKSMSLLKISLDEQLKDKDTVRELHSVLFTKDQEIEELYSKTTELLVSHDVLVSYVFSLKKEWAEFLKESADAQLEGDTHLEDIKNRLLASLASVVPQDNMSHDSVAEGISIAERSTAVLIKNHTQLLSEINHLGQCLAEVSSDFIMPQEKEFNVVIDVACDKLLEHKRNKLDHVEKQKRLEEENQKLLGELDKTKERLDEANANASKVKAELEQTEGKLASAKEKLSMAVTKGKALVQQRDLLKQSLNEKTAELDKCLLELQQKSSALQAAEAYAEEMVETKNLVISLQESLSNKNMALQDLEGLMSQTNSPEEIQSLPVIDKVRWLVNQKSILDGIFLENHRVKDALSSIELPETVFSAELETQVNWLMKSFAQARDDIIKLQDEVIRTREAVASYESELSVAHKEIEHLQHSLLEEKQGKHSLQVRLEDLTCKHEGIIEKVSLLSSEKAWLMKMLLEVSESVTDDHAIDECASYPRPLVENCLEKIRERINISSKSALIVREQLQMSQSLLYVTDQELMLCKMMLEENGFDREEMVSLSNELRRLSEEVLSLKHERDSLQKDLERAEEKSSLIREKLSLAVKKGKGLVQEREGFKLSLDEKNAEIEKLKHELQRQESYVNEFKDQINKLSTDLECIPKLESEVIAMKEQRDLIEQVLAESNSRLQIVVSSIEDIVLPPSIIFKDPVEKMKWLSGYLHESQVVSISMERELVKAKDEADLQASKLADAYTTIRSLEDALSQAEEKISILIEEKKDAVGKTMVEEELRKAKQEADLQASKLVDACVSVKSLEDALLKAEKNISILINEKKDAEIGRARAEQELDKVKEEVGLLASKFTAASVTIKLLEVALLEAENDISMLGNARKDEQVGKAFVEQELEKARQEADSQKSKLADAYATIKSLEDAIAQARNAISVLASEKEEMESKRKQEVIALNAKLAACMEELAVSNGRLENQSSELVSHLNNLQMHLQSESLLSLMTESFKRKFEGLRNLGILIQNIREQFATNGSAWLQFHPGTEDDPHAAKHFSIPQFKDHQNVKMVNNETSVVDVVVSSPFCLPKVIKGFNMQYKLFCENFGGFSSSMDEDIADLSQMLQTTKAEAVQMLKLMESLKLTVHKLEADNHSQENQISTLRNNISILLSACTSAAQELQIQVHNNALDLSSIPGQPSLSWSLYPESSEANGDAVEEQSDKTGASEYDIAADNLLLAVKRIQTQSKQIENVKSAWLMTIEDLQNRLKDSMITAEKAIEDRDLNLNKVSKLEGDIEALNNCCSDLKLRVEDCQAKEDKLREKEAEISSLYCSLAKKDQADKGLLSESQVEALFKEVNKIEILSNEPEAESPEPSFSDPVIKLFYIIDNFVKLQHRVDSLAHGKEELQSTLAAQVREITYLKNEIEALISNNQDLEKEKWDMDELTMGLEKIVQKLGGNEAIEGKKSVDVKELVPVLEKLVVALIVEGESSKSKSLELGNKLHENQMLVDELSAKVKSLEDSLPSRLAPSDTVQERNVFEASSLTAGSEISEIEDAAPLGKNPIPPVPAAAHARMMRKGSSDHLAININLESDRLINHHESEDKGHIFKSLNSSGLIPKHGKLMADRIDGIWVSGGRILMSRPGVRIGLIAYWILLHIWVLGTIF